MDPEREKSIGIGDETRRRAVWMPRIDGVQSRRSSSSGIERRRNKRTIRRYRRS